VLVHADVSALTGGPGAAVGALTLHVGNSESVRVPWSYAIPDPKVDLLSHVVTKTTGPRVSDATPEVLSLVAGAVVPGTEPQLRAVGELDVELWHGDKLLGILAERRELLPGHYTFGLTGRGPDGKPLRTGDYTIRVVVRPDDGTRRQVQSVAYSVR
jgi:hypothetical protein